MDLNITKELPMDTSVIPNPTTFISTTFTDGLQMEPTLSIDSSVSDYHLFSNDSLHQCLILYIYMEVQTRIISKYENIRMIKSHVILH